MTSARMVTTMRRVQALGQVRIPVWVRWVLLAILAALLWLPTGWNVGFVGDDWVLYKYMEQYGLDASAHAYSLHTHSRLLTFLSYFIAYGLSGREFWGANVVLWAMLVAKSGLIDTILRRFHFPSGLAFGVAALSILLPIDWGNFMLGALNVQLGVVMYLGAFTALIAWWQTQRRISLVLMLFCLLILVGTYEAFYPLVFVSPFTLFVFMSPPRISRRWLRVTLVWYVVPILGLLWFLNSSLNGADYQVGLIDRSLNIGAMLNALVTIYSRHLLDIWRVLPTDEMIAYYIAIGAGVAVAVMVFLSSHSDPRPERWRITRQQLAWIVIGLVFIALSLAVFLPTTMRDAAYRIYYLSTAGAALFFVSLIGLIPSRLIRAGLIGVVTVIGTLGILGQHRGYAIYALIQQQYLDDIIQLVPEPPSGSTIMVFDETSDQYWASLFLTSMYLDAGLQFTLADYSIRAGICYPDVEVWGVFIESCDQTPEGINIDINGDFLLYAPTEQMIFLRATDEGLTFMPRNP